MYHIKITKLEANPAVKEWFEETKEARAYAKSRNGSRYMIDRFDNSDIPMPPPEMIDKKQLETVVSEEEFQAIKKACFSQM